MRCQTYLRRLVYGGIIFFLLYIIVFRRRSPRVLLTASDINKFINKQHLNNTHRRRIPRIIHQTWKTHHVPIHWSKTVESLRQLNAEQFEYRLWTDYDMHKFVRKEEPVLYQQTFLTYPLDIQRVDAFRYIVLHRLGGLYIDMDNGCRQPLDSLFNVLEELDWQANHLAAFPRTSPIGISNGFMISTKGHPLFEILISRLSLFNHNYIIDYLTVMLSAGPSYLSINEFYFDPSFHQSAVRIIDEIVYSSIYTWHTPGNSWHGKDAQIILYVYHTVRKSFTQILYCILIAIGFILVFFLYRRQKRKKF